MSSNARELALFNLAIDSKLRACDLTRLQVQDIFMGGHAVARATFMQQKTHRACNCRPQSDARHIDQDRQQSEVEQQTGGIGTDEND
jgi:hypothetical protein